MKLTESQIKEYRRISREELGRDISYEVAEEQLLKSIVFVMTVNDMN